MKFCLYLLIFLFTDVISINLPIVGFFHENDIQEEIAFRVAIEKANTINMEFMPDLTIVPYVEHISVYDSFNVSKRICNLTEEGIGAIFGPQSTRTSGIVKSIADTLEIPHLVTFMDIFKQPSKTTINFFPETTLLAKGILEVVEDRDWKTFVVIFEDNDALVRLAEVFKKFNSLTPEERIPFMAWQIDSEDSDYKPLLKKVASTKESHIILDISIDKILPLLEQAAQVDMLKDYHHYLITSMDAHTLNYSGINIGRTNITTIQFVDTSNHKVQGAVEDWTIDDKHGGKKFKMNQVQTEASLIHDAISIYVNALRGLKEEIELQPLYCDKINTWQLGYSIINYMKLMITDGITGPIKFNEVGQRIQFSLEITQLKDKGFEKIGSWDPENGITYSRNRTKIAEEQQKALSEKVFKVVSRLGAPYLIKKSIEGLSGNEQFEGYSLDLIDEIAKICKFNYSFYVVQEYGAFDKDSKQWTGLIKELRDRNADLAICDLTITGERRSAVDFTKPFMIVGISILFGRAAEPDPDLFSFLNPFSEDIWLYTASAVVGVSLLLYFNSRLTPYEWDNPHPCNPNPEELECNFSLTNCLYFAIGSLMTQGCDILPKSISARIVAGCWWFFVLIITSSYTANLAAFLTQSRMDITFKNVEELENQNIVKYGVLKGGSTAKFFENSNDSLYQKMWSQMESNDGFVKDNEEGVERVLKGKYAYFMESTSIEYRKAQNCDLMQVGGTLDSKGYGIAMPKDSDYRSRISTAVLQLQEAGVLDKLKNKWWKGIKCPVPEDPGIAMTITDVGGVFVVLIMGCCAGLVAAVFEFLWNIRKVAVIEKISPKEAFFLELKFVVQCCDGSTKPVRKPQEGSF